MRPAPPAVVVATSAADNHLAPPSSPATRCNSRSCSWRPYSNSRDFEANAAVILIVLLCALICALALNIVIRCSFRRSHSLEDQQRKPRAAGAAATREEPPTVVFSAGIKLAGAEALCTICLSEFQEGEGIRVLERCNHGFHVQCIRQWLVSHSSCPTCRVNCLGPETSQDAVGHGRGDNRIPEEV